MFDVVLLSLKAAFKLLQPSIQIKGSQHAGRRTQHSHCKEFSVGIPSTGNPLWKGSNQSSHVSRSPFCSPNQRI